MTTAQDRETLVSRLSEIDTSKLPPDGGHDFNRLIFESSPYLLQHATNPVDWHPWGEEAFNKARDLNKPLLVSIGYSTCHWCHVMEHESFEDREVAEVINEYFLPVKVDREERPDIDSLYMTACLLTTGASGWPLNVFMSADQTPFYAATYMPRQARGNTPDIITTLKKIGTLWRSDNRQLLETGKELRAAIIGLESGTETADGELSEAPLRAAFTKFRETFDLQLAGFGQAPKFPMPHNLSLLLRIAQRFDQPEARAMATRTLQAMRMGGLYDHIGFGIHRYAVDAHWRVPHFEKMLYDQALFTLASLDAYQSTSETFYARVADQTMGYVLRELTLPEGGFCSGEDADTGGIEGNYYLWTQNQVMDVLGPQHATIFCNCYEIHETGTFEGSNIPHLEMDIKEWAQWFGTDPDELGMVLEDGRRKLLAARDQRLRPHRDDKVLSGWNGLTIAAMARTGNLLNHPEYVESATRAADFVLDNLRDDTGRLQRRWRRGKAGIPAFLEDYAGLALGLIELFQACFDPRYLQEALRLEGEMRELFGNAEGFYHDTGTDAEQVLLRKRTLHDGAMPSGNSLSAWATLRLAALTGETALEKYAEQILRVSARQWQEKPTTCSVLLTALDTYLAQQEVLVIVADRNDPEAQKMVETALSGFRPHLTIIRRMPDDPELERLTPLVRGKDMQNDHATAYLCRGRTCQTPIATAQALAKVWATGKA